MSDPGLRRMLALEEAGSDSFVAYNPETDAVRVFGGQVAAQALRAATLTVPDAQRPNSMPSYFLRPAVPGRPITSAVERLRDGRSCLTRRVVARQDTEPILTLAASFHVEEVGYDCQPSGDMENLPLPQDLPPRPGQRGVTDVREVPLTEDRRGNAGHRVLWIRTLGELPDDPDIQACALTYVTDRGPMGSARKAVTGESRQSSEIMNATLDHCLWFHRPLCITDWHLYELSTRSARGARSLAQGVVRSRTGDVVATVSQEVLIRPVKHPS